MLRRQFALGASALAAGGLVGRGARAAAPSLPFDFLLERQILLPVTVNGRPAEAWLDSGASASVVDAHFAEALGLPLGDHVRAAGVSRGVTGVRMAEIDLQVGRFAWRRRPVAVMDFAALAAVTPRPVQILLGRDFFEAAAVEIDFTTRRMTLTPHKAFRPPAGAPLPLRPAGPLKRFPISIAGGQTWAVMDLGNAGALMLDRGLAETWRLLEGRKLSTLMSVGADGPRKSEAVSLDRVALAGLAFDKVPVDLVVDPATRAPANVGLGLLSRFHLTIDFGGGRLWMRPYADAERRPFRKNRSGLATLRDGDRLEVTFVADSSPAQAAGWKVGDLITAVDGRAIDGEFAASPAALFSYGRAGERVTFRMADGSRRSLTLGDYY